MVLRGDPAGGRRARGSGLIDGVRAFHAGWGWAAIAANAVAGVGGLVAWWQPSLRGRWVWILAAVAEVAIVVQVVAGVALVAGDRYGAPRFHLFYGYVAFVTVALAYSSRDSMRGRLQLIYGPVGLFLMGLGLRAIVELP